MEKSRLRSVFAIAAGLAAMIAAGVWAADGFGLRDGILALCLTVVFMGALLPLTPPHRRRLRLCLKAVLVALIAAICGVALYGLDVANLLAAAAKNWGTTLMVLYLPVMALIGFGWRAWTRWPKPKA